MHFTFGNFVCDSPKYDPAARPIERASNGGNSPNGFSLSVRPSLSKSIVSGKLIVIFDRKPSSGYRTSGNDNVGVILNTVPGGKARRPSSVIQIKRFFRECGLVDSSVLLLLLWPLNSSPPSSASTFDWNPSAKFIVFDVLCGSSFAVFVFDIERLCAGSFGTISHDTVVAITTTTTNVLHHRRYMCILAVRYVRALRANAYYEHGREMWKRIWNAVNDTWIKYTPTERGRGGRYVKMWRCTC